MKIRLFIIGTVLLTPLVPASAANRYGDEAIVIDGGTIKMPGISIGGGKVIVGDAENGGNGAMAKGQGGGSYSYSSSSVTVINGDVYIDGEQVPRDVTRYTSKTGTVYKIQRSGSSVSVTTE